MLQYNLQLSLRQFVLFATALSVRVKLVTLYKTCPGPSCLRIDGNLSRLIPEAITNKQAISRAIPNLFILGSSWCSHRPKLSPKKIGPASKYCLELLGQGQRDKSCESLWRTPIRCGWPLLFGLCSYRPVKQNIWLWALA